MPASVEPRVVATRAVASFTSALAVGALLELVTEGPVVERNGPSTALEYVADAAGLLLVAPVVETLCIAAIFAGLRRRLNDKWAACISATALTLAHCAASPMWGLTVAIPFVVFTAPFRSVGERPLREAVVASALIHALHNTFVLGGLAIVGRWG